MFAYTNTEATSQQQVPQETSVLTGYTDHPGNVNKHKGNCNLYRARSYIDQKRKATWGWQDKLSVPRTSSTYNERSIKGCKYLKWSGRQWAHKERDAHKLYVRLQDHEAAICYVFGPYCQQAIKVSACESGWAHSIHAHNGQYLGMFQMGSYARHKYGHGNSPLIQARAAYHYFIDSGKDWSPWSCKP